MVVVIALCLSLTVTQAQNGSGSDNAHMQVEPGQPEVLIHGTVESALRARGNAPPSSGSTSANLIYQGGTGGVGVEVAPAIVLVLWGSQWNNNDPSGEAAILQSFYSNVGGSAWLNSVVQYCEGVASGTVFCNGSGTPSGNQPGMFLGTWVDNATAAPSRPKQSDFANEAIRAAAHYGITSNNINVQYVIATSHGNNSIGFGTQFCAYHSSTSSAYGRIAYTNLPYMTDAGASCGANFNGLGPNAGITIVGGHELAETISDPFPNSGWLDKNGAENADKCAWIQTGQGASAVAPFANGTSFPVQSLWSNAFNNKAGGCVISYP